eukprot:scaffold65752_cov58-Attheya_sp.AAC.4
MTSGVNNANGVTNMNTAGAAVVGRSKLWTWKGHNIYTQVTTPTTNPNTNTLFDFPKQKTNNKKPTVLLIHGFGCSTTYWRATMSALTRAGYPEVHAIDLLGQGQSAKPSRPKDGVEYSIDLWAQLVDDYARAHISSNTDVILVGNSLGSVVALSAVTGDYVRPSEEKEEGTRSSLGVGPSFLKDRTKGICMFNCGGGMNSKGIANEPQWSSTQRALLKVIFSILDTLIFKNQALLQYVLTDIVTKELLRNALQSLYKCSPERVDDELVDSFFRPAKDPGAVDALSQIYVNDPGKTPMTFHREYDDILSHIPMQLIWGDDDAVTPLEGGVGQFYVNMAKDKEQNVSFDIVQSGHVPFDDNPDQSNGVLLRWLDDLKTNDYIFEHLFVLFPTYIINFHDGLDRSCRYELLPVCCCHALNSNPPVSDSVDLSLGLLFLLEVSGGAFVI